MTIQRALVKLRKGPESTRDTVIPNAGEVLATIDTHKLYLGDGVEAGGHDISNYDMVVKDISDHSDSSSVGSLAWWITQSGINPKTILINRSIDILNDLTIPENICIKFTRSGKLNVATTKTVTINGAIEAGLWQIFAGDGTITGSPKIKAVYPEWFGAVGDGITDDAIPIMAAMTSFESSPVVFFSKKIYAHTGISIVTNSIIIRGISSTESKLLHIGLDSDVNTYIQPDITSSMGSVTIENICFSGGWSALKITGLYDEINLSCSPFKKIFISNCSFLDTNSCAVHLTYFNDVKFINNYIWHGGDNGVFITSGNKAICSQNIFEDCKGSGSITFGYNLGSSETSKIGDSIISNNVITVTKDYNETQNSAIYIAYGNNVSVSDNTMNNHNPNTSKGFKVGIIIDEWYSDAVVISNNTITGASEYGIRFGNTSTTVKLNDVQIKGNIIRGGDNNKTRIGIYIIKGSNINILNNVIDNVSKHGIQLSECCEINIFNNIIKDVNQQSTYATYCSIYLGTNVIGIAIKNNLFIDTQLYIDIDSTNIGAKYSVDESGSINFYNDGSTLTTTINPIGLSWADLVTQISALSGWTATLNIPISGTDRYEYDTTIINAMRRTGKRQISDVNLLTLPSVLTTSEPMYYINEHGKNIITNGNTIKSGVKKPPYVHHADSHLFYFGGTNSINDNNSYGGHVLGYAESSDLSNIDSPTYGDIVFNSSPVSTGIVGWVYTTSGWKTFGTIES